MNVLLFPAPGSPEDNSGLIPSKTLDYLSGSLYSGRDHGFSPSYLIMLKR